MMASGASDAAPQPRLAERDRPWMMRTYAGHSDAKRSNELYRSNIEKGQTGLSIAFDLPTQTGYDPDDELARGEVGKVGVGIAHEGDMRTIRLRRTFDGVFVYDAICHMTTEADLRAVMETSFEHLRPGGVALFVPDFVRETFVEYTDHGGNDTPRGSVRYVQWVTDPDPRDSTYQVDFGILIRDTKAQTRLVHDRHTYGLFPRPTWRRLMREVGFDLRSVKLPDGFGRDLFAGRRKG